MISINVQHGGDLAKTILSACRERIIAGKKPHGNRVTKWRQNEELFTAYIPESEADALRRSRRENVGRPEYTTIQMPYSYAVAMAAYSYWTSVFLARSPVFQFMGDTDEGEMQVLALEALHQYQVRKGRMLANLYIYFQDVPKYGEAWVFNYWREDEVRVSNIVEEPEMFEGLVETGRTVKRRKITTVKSYQGNALLNIHPGKVITDPRYSRGRFQDGEFVAIETELSRNQLVIGEATGQYINVDKLGKKTQSQGEDAELIGSEEHSGDIRLERPSNTDFGTEFDPKASNVYKVYEVYVNLIPKTWKLGSGSMPEKWVFTVDKDFTTVLECRPMGHLHDRFPLAYIEIEPEGYAQFSRSLLEIYSPVQHTIDWLINSHFFNVRQILNNQMVLDPSRVETRDLETGEPGLMIRLKPAAYGSDARTAVHQLNVQDVTRSHMADLSMMYDMGERLGISDSVQGLSAPSSRRSAQEIRGDQAFGMSRLKTNAEYFSATGFSDLGMMMLSNSQQYFDGEMKLRIAGAAAELAGQGFVNVDPNTIAGAYSVEPVDGTLPVDRFAQMNLWQNLLTNMAGVPQVIQQYDLGKIFGYVAQLGGIKNLNRFKIQLMPDEAMQMAAQAGNAIPMNGAGNALEPGQVPGVGPTA